MEMQFDFRQVPFVRLLIPLIIGISIFYVRLEYFVVFNIVIVLCLAALIVMSLFSVFEKYARLLKGIMIFLTLFWCGIICCYTANRHFIFPEQKTTYSGLVYRQPVIKNNSLQIECRLNYLLNGDKLIKIFERIKLYYKNDSIICLPEPGDSLIFTAKIERIRNRSNPKEFDYAKYMATEGIYYAAFLSNVDLYIGGNSRQYPIKRFAASIQQTIINKFEQYSIKDEELAVISALVVGNTERLDKEIKGNYTASGAMHILAVSGWHIGILYLFLNVLFGKRNHRLYYTLLRMVINLLVIWLYAFITGLSPSVVRAAVMFSLFLAGKSFSRSTNSYNILAASALIILVIDPNELFMAGFQLSYLAVLGILFFQPRFTNMLTIKYSLLDNIWQLFTVSFAAQLVTFPLCLYYFHQFPNYFWLTNILVIPVVWIIMVITILFFCALPFVPIAELLSNWLDWSLKLMNFIIDHITKLPYAVISNIKFEFFHLTLFSSLVFIICFLVYSGRKKYLIPLLELVILFLLIFEITTYCINDRRQEIIFYRTDKGPAISLISGHKHLLLADTSITNNPAEFERSTSYYWKCRQIDKSTEQIILNTLEPGTSIRDVNISIKQKKDGLSIDFNKKRFFLINYENIDIVDAKEKSVADYIIVNKSSGYPNSNIMQEFNPSVIVIVGRVSYGICRTWNIFATKNKIGFYDVNQNGALHLRL